MQAKLVPVDGGQPIPITRDVTVIGRGRDLCDVLLQQTSISKLQCLVAKTDGLLFIRDLGSTNGTKVNGQRVTRGALLPGDELAFASVKFRVHLGPTIPSEEGHVGPDERTSIIEQRFEAPSEEYEAVDSEEADPQAADSEDAAPDAIEPAQSNSDVRLLSDDSAVS
jgi:pSer/pThr/pTyr-binding forkhead associated (FHA) protein